MKLIINADQVARDQNKVLLTFYTQLGIHLILLQFMSRMEVVGLYKHIGTIECQGYLYRPQESLSQVAIRITISILVNEWSDSETGQQSKRYVTFEFTHYPTTKEMLQLMSIFKKNAAEENLANAHSFGDEMYMSITDRLIKTHTKRSGVWKKLWDDYFLSLKLTRQKKQKAKKKSPRSMRVVRKKKK